MRLAGIHENDLVRCDVKGDRFLAFVTDTTDRGLQVAPIMSNGHSGTHFARTVSARQVVEHWRKRSNGNH